MIYKIKGVKGDTSKTLAYVDQMDLKLIHQICDEHLAACGQTLAENYTGIATSDGYVFIGSDFHMYRTITIAPINTLLL